MKKVLIGAAASALLLGSLALSALAAGPIPYRPDGTNADPDIYNASWVTGVSQDGGMQGQSIALTDLAFYSFPNWWNFKLNDGVKVRASFLKAQNTINAGGSPRFSLELDANANGKFIDPAGNSTDEDVTVYLDPATCSDPAAASGGWVEADFTGARENCTFSDSKSNIYVSDASGTAWNKLVAAYPDAKVWFMFLIQDATTGTNYVDRIMLDSSFFTNQP
jgi:hypothetical protein